MSTSKPRSINGLFLLVAVVGLVFGSAAPAAASHLTVSKPLSLGGIGEEWGPSVNQLCSSTQNVFTGAHFTTTYYLLTETVEYKVHESGANDTHFIGPISMNIQHGDMVSAPLGAAPGTCATYGGGSIAPAPVPLTRARVHSRNDNNVNCDSPDPTPGTYNRSGATVHFDFNVSCTIASTLPVNPTRMVWLNYDVYGIQGTDGYLKGITHSIAVSGNGHP